MANLKRAYSITLQWPYHDDKKLFKLNTPEHEIATAIKERKRAKIRNRYNQVPHLTQDTVWESDKNTRKHHIQDSQEVSPFPAGDHKIA